MTLELSADMPENTMTQDHAPRYANECSNLQPAVLHRKDLQGLRLQDLNKPKSRVAGGSLVKLRCSGSRFRDPQCLNLQIPAARLSNLGFGSAQSFPQSSRPCLTTPVRCRWPSQERTFTTPEDSLGLKPESLNIAVPMPLRHTTGDADAYHPISMFQPSGIHDNI